MIHPGEQIGFSERSGSSKCDSVPVLLLWKSCKICSQELSEGSRWFRKSNKRYRDNRCLAVVPSAGQRSIPLIWSDQTGEETPLHMQFNLLEGPPKVALRYWTYVTALGLRWLASVPGPPLTGRDDTRPWTFPRLSVLVRPKRRWPGFVRIEHDAKISYSVKSSSCM